jgi:hypothetical protein
MSSSPVLLDANGWIALLNKRDPLNPSASALWREVGRARRLVFLTDWVIAETGNGLARTAARRLFGETVAIFQRSAWFRIVTISAPLRDRALALYSDRSDKTWGLVDCASFVVMADHEIIDAFTTDEHFAQAGFHCLLPASAR